MTNASVGGHDFTYVDADNHYYEADDCFTRYIDPVYRDRAVHVVQSPDDTIGRPYVGNQPLTFLSRSLCHRTGRPGAFIEFMSGQMTRDEAMAAVIDPHDFPAFFDRDARLAVMDDQGVEAALMLPTLGVCTEPQLREEGPDVLAANLAAFNRWLEDDWGYDYKCRLFAVPLLSLFDLDAAGAELDRVLAAGARAVHLFSMPIGDRSPFDPIFDAFWARLNAAEAVLVLHGCDSGYQRFMPDWSENPDANVDGGYSPLQHYLFFIERPISDMVAAMLLHNLFGRFPNIRVAIIENGSTWVVPLLARLDKCWTRAPQGPWVGGRPERPSEVFRRHVYVTPFAEERVDDLLEVIGPERVMLGSDFPHPEGLAAPGDYASLVADFGPDVVRKFMRDNAADLFGVDARPGGPAEVTTGIA